MTAQSWHTKTVSADFSYEGQRNLKRGVGFLPWKTSTFGSMAVNCKALFSCRRQQISRRPYIDSGTNSASLLEYHFLLWSNSALNVCFSIFLLLPRPNCLPILCIMADLAGCIPCTQCCLPWPWRGSCGVKPPRCTAPEGVTVPEDSSLQGQPVVRQSKVGHMVSVIPHRGDPLQLKTVRPAPASWHIMLDKEPATHHSSLGVLQ